MHSPNSLTVTRDQVERLELELQRFPQVECPVWHFFAPGLYARQMLIPAGVCLTGAVHRSEHLCIVSGDINVTTDDGVRRITAAQEIITSKPGAKRAGFAYIDTYWATVHASDERDLDKLARELFESENCELMGGSRNAQALAQADREDYARFLDEYGLTQEYVTRLVENETDQMFVPIYALELRASPIAGNGMFAAQDIAECEFIGPARIGNKRTPAGRYINHSAHPNCHFVSVVPGGDLMVYAIAPIRAGEEVTIDYRQAMRVNGAGFKPIGEAV